jgi:5-methylthioadenosine/S-adenosylhomocysteine deaminase
MGRRGEEPVLLRGCRWLISCWNCPAQENVSVLLRDGAVEWIGGSGAPPGAASGRVVECGRRSLAAPCLYNAHTHVAMSLLRGFYDDAELHEWLRRMWFVERRLDAETVYHAARLSLAELAMGGVCGFMDMYFFPEAVERAAREVGLRARLGPVIMGDVDPARAVEEAARYASMLQGDPLVGGVVNVHSIYAAPLEAVRLGAEKAGELRVPFHIHVSETRREVYEAKKRYGVFPVELLHRLGALGPNTVLVHMGWVASWELGLVREAGASIVHCPASNMKLATAGHFPLREALDMGINVGLGTDGPASNNTQDMVREMRLVVLLQRHSYWDTRVAARDALRIATEGSAKAMMLPPGAGRLEPGAPGDLAVFDLSHPRVAPARRDNIVQALVYAASAADTAATIVAGHIVYIKGGEEERRLLGAAVESSERLNRFLEELSVGEDEPPCSPPVACRR